MTLHSLSWKRASVFLIAICATLHLHAQFPGGGGGGGFGGGGFGGGGGAGGRGRSATSRQYPPAGTIGDAIFSIDPDSHNLIVIADPETTAAISQVISNLDRPQPQVLIKVVFLEVTHNNSSDIGVEGSFSQNALSSWLTGGVTTNTSVGSSNNLVTTLVPGMASGLVNGTNSFSQFSSLDKTLITGGGGVYTILGQDFTATLHLVAQNGHAKVLSRPSIVARNNQPATILVGQTVPLTTSVRYDSLGNAINGITYTDVGIILRVTPFITPDGYVQMILTPEISSISSAAGIPISSGINPVTAPIIDKRSADTVVVTPDGQTVIIGGLIENSKALAISKVPFLGDIPILGGLFQRRQQAEVKTELLIFLTPIIIPAPSELAALSERERMKLQAPRSFSEKDLNEVIDTLPWKPPESPLKKKSNKAKP